MNSNLGKSFKQCAESLEELSKSLNKFLVGRSVEELLETFTFNDGFDFVEAIEYYKEIEMYNCCEALEIAFTKHLQNDI